MSVWYCIPSARPLAEAQVCLREWNQLGYKVAAWRDYDADVCGSLVMTGGILYPGYARATNGLIAAAMRFDPAANIFVVGGDDIFPDLAHNPETVEREFFEHFGGTYGVMQPTGDRWGSDPKQPNYAGSAYADRVASSAWIGREFCERAYNGNGPLWPEYFHMFVDEELQAVAEMLGVFWQRPDITQMHRHWAREGKPMPEFLTAANSPQHWNKYKALFESRKAAGFPCVR